MLLKKERRHNLEKARNVQFLVFVETCTLSEKDAKIGSIYAVKPGIVVVNTDKTNNNWMKKQFVEHWKVKTTS